jgi:hypothetical protein
MAANIADEIYLHQLLVVMSGYTTLPLWRRIIMRQLARCGGEILKRKLIILLTTIAVTGIIISGVYDINPVISAALIVIGFAFALLLALYLWLSK